MQPRLRLCLIVFAVVLGMLAVGCPYVRVRPLDEARVETLRTEINAIIATGTCSVDTDCDVVALGGPCGPISEYLPYAPATVDQVALNDRIGEYNDLQPYVRPPNLACTDMLPIVPALRCENTVCVAHTPAGPQF